MNLRTTSSTNTVNSPTVCLLMACTLKNFTETAISNAVEDAIGTALKWGSPVNRENRQEGGVAWSTYKAICRRNGTYVNAQGPHVSGLTPKSCLCSGGSYSADMHNQEWNIAL